MPYLVPPGHRDVSLSPRLPPYEVELAPSPKRTLMVTSRPTPGGAGGSPDPRQGFARKRAKPLPDAPIPRTLPTESWGRRGVRSSPSPWRTLMVKSVQLLGAQAARLRSQAGVWHRQTPTLSPNPPFTNRVLGEKGRSAAPRQGKTLFNVHPTPGSVWGSPALPAHGTAKLPYHPFGTKPQSAGRGCFFEGFARGKQPLRSRL